MKGILLLCLLVAIGILLIIFFVVKRIKDSWWYARRKLRKLKQNYDNDNTLGNLSAAYEYVLEYFKAHPDCLPAAWNVAWLIHLGQRFDTSMFDINYAIKLGEYVYSRGDTDAAWLLSRIFKTLAANADKGGNDQVVETLKNKYFRWLNEFVDNNKRKDKDTKREVVSCKIDLAKCYSEGYGTEMNFEMAEIIFSEVRSRGKKNFEYVLGYADHLLRRYNRDAEKWYRKAYKLATDFFQKSECLYGLSKTGDAFLDISLMDFAREQLEQLYLQAKALGSQLDKDTLWFVAESYMLAENEYRCNIARITGKEYITVMRLPECEDIKHG